MFCFKCNKPISSEDNQLHGVHEPCFKEWFDIALAKDFTNVAAKSPSSVQGFSKINSSFFHGKFKKYSAELGEQSYILKVLEKGYPELPKTEFLCNKIADHLGLQVADHYFIKFHGEDTFVTKNFVKKGKKGNLIHIYRFLSGEIDFTISKIVSVIEKETQRLKDVERFVELCLFDSLIGNHDRHGRNFGILESPGKKILAPFYDNPSYLGTETENLLAANHSPKGAIATSETTEPTMVDYIKEFKKLGHENVVLQFNKKLILGEVLGLVRQSMLSDMRQNALIKLIQERYEELQSALRT